MSDADKNLQARGGDMGAPERISVEFNEAGFPVGTWVGGFGQDSTTYIRADLMAELVEALRFYAEGEWPQDYPGGVLYAAGDDTPEFKTHIDYGNRARSALKGAKP